MPADQPERWFGTPHTLETAAEKHGGRASTNDSDAIFQGYRALDARTGGRYRAFLTQAARCGRCAADRRIPESKQPISLLCGTLPDPATAESAHVSLDAYRRLGPEHGSLRINVDDGLDALATFVEAQAITGLSIGHCGWGDMTARLRGSQFGDGVDVMILGADWYPLTACSNFMLDRYPEGDHTLGTFHRRLREADTSIPSDLRELFQRFRLYLGNTLLCYRTGLAKQGVGNLSRHSFENCRDHLKRHIQALEPRLIATFGREPARSVAHLIEGHDASSVETLRSLRTEPALKKIMEARSKNDASGSALRGTLDGSSIVFVPLCHPSMPNRYANDYRSLAHELALLRNAPEQP